MNILKLLDRKNSLFKFDLKKNQNNIDCALVGARVLVVGAAGTIGSAVSAQIFKRFPSELHLVDISENNLVETVRYLRSLNIKSDCNLRSFVSDVSSDEFVKLVKNFGPYDYVLNLSALKHVRSERDPYSLYRLMKTNIVGSIKLNALCEEMKVRKYFCVSTDKAADPINAMGCSKRAMEVLLLSQQFSHPISFARFANVAFSDGSLLDGFNKRFKNNQPLTAPKDISRYFITPEEAGNLCLISTIFAQHGEVFIPENNQELKPIKFELILQNFLLEKGFVPKYCHNESEARNFFTAYDDLLSWPVYLFDSDTSGEKSIEIFSSVSETVLKADFKEISKVKVDKGVYKDANQFIQKMDNITTGDKIIKEDLLNLLSWVVPEFEHLDTGKSLDERM